jgi:hypothetical protein
MAMSGMLQKRLYKYQTISGDEITSAILPNARPRAKPIPVMRVIPSRTLTAKGMPLQRITIPAKVVIQIPIAAFLISCELGATDRTRLRVR